MQQCVSMKVKAAQQHRTVAQQAGSIAAQHLSTAWSWLHRIADRRVPPLRTM
jgi:hypothetical protein